jgi:tRNA-specific 2-thiouridylase
MAKVAVAMSGGVDSSVTAALMVQKYGAENVFGVTMRLFCYGEAEVDEKACCSTQAVNDAKSVCNQLGIAHYAINMEKEFEEAVIKNFISEYQLGHTPIPCVLCNTIIKFDYLLKKVQGLGADFLATGHYARVTEQDGQYFLKRGLDDTKDQTYFLYGLNQEQLAHTLFPVGEMKKTEVRKEAAKLGLKTAEKKESQGICFVTEGRVTDWLQGKIKTKPGEIINTVGEKIGEHEGIVFYTVGQRKRIGGGFAEPMYVVQVDAAKNQVVIGTKEDLYRSDLEFKNPNWINGEPELPKKCTAKIRYNMGDEACVLQVGNKVRFKKAQRAITPGQSIVFYDGDAAIGGAIIAV